MNSYTFDRTQQLLPYYLPKGKSGKVSVTTKIKKAGEKLPVVSMRNAIFMGLKPTTLVLEKDTRIHYLNENGRGMWMSSMPQEIEQHTRQMMGFSGKVLLGGLGLGLAIALLEANDDVEQVICVEKSSAIIGLVAPHLPTVKTTIIHGDLYKFLTDIQENSGDEGFEFDHAFYDIWQPTGQSVLAQHVIPLRRLSLGIVPQDQIECWNEDEMLGQIKLNLQFACNPLTGQPHPLIGHAEDQQFYRYRDSQELQWPFICWLRRVKPSVKHALKTLDRFMDAMKDPEKYESDWRGWDFKSP